MISIHSNEGLDSLKRHRRISSLVNTIFLIPMAVPCLPGGTLKEL
jgi:hypothetical protein